MLEKRCFAANENISEKLATEEGNLPVLFPGAREMLTDNAIDTRPPAAPRLRLGLLSWLATRIRRARTRRALAALDDRMLRDIGLTRADL